MAKGKIVVIGANQTGLAAALFCAREGFVATVYDAKQPEDIAYDWTDDVEVKVFEEVGLPEPPEGIYYRKRCWTFLPPDKSCRVKLELPEEELDYSVKRRPFNEWMEGLAEEAGVKVEYGARVGSLVIEGNKKVTGVVLESGETVDADLVVDCSGVDSPFRDSLPEEMGIPAGYDPYDTFIVRRSFFERAEGSEYPEDTNKAYFLHLGHKGISWVIIGHDGTDADVLIGRVAELSDEEHEAALEDLRKDNPIIGEALLKGGETLKIPVRRPISKMFADGYVLMGDSAYMTIPLMGSGIAAGLRAAKYLSIVLANPVGKPFLSRNLYRYQLFYMHKTGAKHAGIDVMKRWILHTQPENIDFLFSSGSLDNALLEAGATGEGLALTIPQKLVVGLRGRRKPILLAQLAAQLRKLKKATALADDMPLVYLRDSFEKWQKQYEDIYPLTAEDGDENENTDSDD